MRTKGFAACHKRPSAAGLTLAELIIVLFLFGIFSDVIANSVVQAYYGQVSSSTQQAMVRDGTIAVDTLARELRLCQQVYLPDPSSADFLDGGTYSPASGTNSPFIFRYPSSSAACGQMVVAYQRDGPTQTLQRFVYECDFDPNSTATQNIIGSTIALANNVQQFALTRQLMSDNGFVVFIQAELTLQSSTNKNPLELGITTPVEGLGPGY